MAALMSSVVDKADDVVAYIADCRELGRSLPEKCAKGLEVLPPHVNESNWKFTVVGDGIGQVRFGLGAIRGIGEGAVRSILAAREAEGPFASMFDLLNRIDLRVCNKRVLEALICSGALDGFAPEAGRPQLLAALDATFAAAQQAQRDRESAQENIFGDLLGDGGGTAGIAEPPLPRVEPWPESERLKREKEVLGFFISGHPLDRFREEIALFARVTTANLKEFRDQKIELACVVTDTARQISKRDGAEWGRIAVEDFLGTATVLAFGEIWLACKDLLQKDAPVLLRGSVSGRERDEEDPPIFLDGVVALSSIRESGEVGLCIDISADRGGSDAVERARVALAGFPGPAPLLVRWYESESTANGGGGESILRSRTLSVVPSEELLTELREVFGDDRVRLVRA
jgi:DNA polymerase-3 subunit alpha